MNSTTAHHAAAFVNLHCPPRPAEVVKLTDGAHAVLIYSAEVNTKTRQSYVTSDLAFTYNQARDILGY